MTLRRRIPNNTGARINTTSAHGWCHTACIYRERE